MKLGGTETIKVDTRVIAATNSDLEYLIGQKMFREDLFYRLNVIKIELPSLRERKEDIPLLVKHFLEIYSKENNKKIVGISEDTMEIINNYDWPGNIRELENLIERAVVLTKSKLITRKNLPPFLLKSQEAEKTVFFSSDNKINLKKDLLKYQKTAIINALKKANGVQKKAASFLEVKPTTLNEIIKRLKIDVNNL
ncbi:MAG: sigma 54-interacting transcriptional regulator, partial [Acidobacteriota bacterium]|nr:sigma 54-interacting transcriptional regulator [Acidobacteriota bacterium]